MHKHFILPLIFFQSNLKNSKTIVDFALNAEADPNNRGKIILYISLLSAFGLKKIDFSYVESFFLEHFLFNLFSSSDKSIHLL